MTAVRRIEVVNPNTTVAMTEKMLICALPLVDPGTELVGVTNAGGSASIESHVDEALAVPGLLREISAGEAAGVSGYVVPDALFVLAVLP